MATSIALKKRSPFSSKAADVEIKDLLAENRRRKKETEDVYKWMIGLFCDFLAVEGAPPITLAELPILFTDDNVAKFMLARGQHTSWSLAERKRLMAALN